MSTSIIPLLYMIGPKCSPKFRWYRKWFFFWTCNTTYYARLDYPGYVDMEMYLPKFRTRRSWCVDIIFQSDKASSFRYIR